MYTDVVRPMKKDSLGRPQYFVTTFSEHRGFPFIRFMNKKSKISEAAIEMIRDKKLVLSENGDFEV